MGSKIKSVSEFRNKSFVQIQHVSSKNNRIQNVIGLLPTAVYLCALCWICF